MALRDLDAAATLRGCGISRGPHGWPDYHTLPYLAVEHLSNFARALGYRHPKHANGSRARYFYAALVRLSDKAMVAR